LTRFPKTLVSIHAHPDDTESFCAGTMALMRAKGYEVVIVTVTPGGLGGIGSTEAETATIRKKEAEAAASLLGARYYCADGRDGYLYDTEALRIQITEILRKERAGIVMTHLPFDYHSDHRTTCNIVEAATMVAALPNVPAQFPPLPVTPLLYHTSPLGLSDPLGEESIPPHFYVDISSVMHIKMQMLEKHQSQIELMRVMHRMADFFGEMKKHVRLFGEQAHCDYAEAFWQHLGGGFQKDALLQETLAEFVIENKVARPRR
jgi:LmbE family N-acetylglucosaminyl deacetylase